MCVRSPIYDMSVKLGLFIFIASMMLQIYTAMRYDKKNFYISTTTGSFRKPAHTSLRVYFLAFRITNERMTVAGNEF